MASEAVYVPQQGALAALLALVSDMTNGPQRGKLYDSNTPYLPTRVVADYTEASFPGYAALTITWSAPVINGFGKAQASGGTLSWTFTGSTGTATIFGIFLTEPAGTKLLAVVPFLTPVVLTPAARTLSYAFNLTDTSEL